MREVAGGQAAADAPGGSDCGERLEHEAAALELGMWYGEAARAEAATAPQDDIEIEHARPPPATEASAECALQGFQAQQHRCRIEVALNQCHGIGEVSPRSTVSGVEDD